MQKNFKKAFRTRRTKKRRTKENKEKKRKNGKGKKYCFFAKPWQALFSVKREPAMGAAGKNAKNRKKTKK